ncbi:hypothetical protein ANN_17356 [Periplaneta americana]|uniref:Reverse transcriptase domain-containing protein n=1 Tax=Periplaneta americana TaxID=6978 RepID=A0ABQ8SU04_PERAM|nr:hypothetical protein ANN_17356 [Periplaneta americana]
MLGEEKEILPLCNEIYEKGEWPEDFSETLLLSIPKKNNAKKCNKFRTINLISQTAKILLRILNRRLYSKMEGQLEEELFGFRKGKVLNLAHLKAVRSVTAAGTLQRPAELALGIPRAHGGQICGVWRSSTRLRREISIARPLFVHVFQRLAKRVRTNGVVQPKHNKGERTRRPVRNEKEGADVLSAIVNPHDSTRRTARDSRLHHSTVFGILKDNKFHLYHIHLHQELGDITFRLVLISATGF